MPTTASLDIDLAQVRRELALLPNMVGDNAQKALVRLEATVRRAEVAAKKSTRALARAQRESDRQAAESARQAREGLKGVAELAGISTDKVDKLGAVWTALASPIGVAAVAVAAATLAVGGLVAGIGAAVFKADELEEKLRPLQKLEGFGVNGAALASIQAANDSLDALVAIGQQATVMLGAQYAPAIERAAVVTVKLGLMALDAFAAFQDGGEILRDLSVFLVGSFVRSLLSPVGGLTRIVDLLGDLAGVAGADGLAADLHAVRQGWVDWTDDIARTAVDFYFDAASDAVGALDEATASYDGRARELIGTVGDLADAQDKNAKKTRDAERRYRELMKAFEEAREAQRKLADLQADLSAAATGTEDELRINREFERRIDLLDDIAKKFGYTAELEATYQAAAAERERELAALQDERARAAADALAERVRAEEEAARRIAEARKAEYVAAATTVSDFFGTASDVAAAAAAATDAANAAAARRWLTFAKAASLFEVGVNTSVAISKAFAQGGVLGFLSSLSVAGRLALEVGKIRRMSIPTFADTPGPVRVSERGAVMRFHAEDTVIAGQSKAALQRQVDEMPGASGGGLRIVAVPMYEGRAWNRAVRDAVRQPSPLSAALRDGGSVGQGGW